MSASCVMAAYPEGYYDSLEGKCGAELMRAVKNVVARHTVISYGSDTWNAFKYTDVRNIDGVDCWWDMYSNARIPVSQGRPDPSVMNIEHSVANSWWGKTKNDAYKDIVHLNPSDSKANSSKGNYPLSEVATVKYTNGVTTVGTPKSGQGGGSSSVFEPADEYKGDFARVYMYMFTVYNDISWKTSGTNWMYDTSSPTMFKSWARDLLLRWHDDDPVSTKERNRNDGVYSQQKNRNPFIDLPDLALHIWGSKSNVPFSLTGTPPGPGPDDPNPEDPALKTQYLWLAQADSGMGEWTTEDISMPDVASYIWSWKEYGGRGCLCASAFIKNTAYAARSYAWSPEVDMYSVTKATFTFEHAAKYQTTIRELCKVAVKDLDSGETHTLDIASWPQKGDWAWSGSGNIDLSGFSGKKIKVGFLYESTESGADTWEIDNARLSLERKPSGVCTPDAEDLSFLVEVWGNNVLMPEGARLFDLNGREYDGCGLAPGVYIVTGKGFGKSVKVTVR